MLFRGAAVPRARGVRVRAVRLFERSPTVLPRELGLFCLRRPFLRCGAGCPGNGALVQLPVLRTTLREAA